MPQDACGLCAGGHESAAGCDAAGVPGGQSGEDEMMPAFLHVLAIGFLSPLLMAAGAAATSIPIIIHLLNKRKFRVVVWAAMEWLLAAQRRNARRLKFQRWLLLAVRCLALLIIAAGIAQLILQSQAFGSILGGEQRAGTPYEKAKRLVADYVGRLRSSDQVLVIRTSTGGPEESANIKPTVDHQS